MGEFIHQLRDWPAFHWDQERLAGLLASVRHRQGRLLGRMEALGFNLRAEASLQTLTEDVLKSSEIEGENLNPEQVRSSLARQLGMEIGGLTLADQDVEGVVEMMLDATQQYNDLLTPKRLFGWHAALFPLGYSGMYKILTGMWRKDQMEVVSGPMGKQRVHYQAPGPVLLPDEMDAFLKWFNTENGQDPFIKAAIAHVWFVTIHPFDDGNGRIARAITDMLLARADGSPQRFYSMSAQIRKARNAYYDILEETQRGDLDITEWLSWFIHCLDQALSATDETLAVVLKKAKFWEKNASLSFNDRQRKMLNKLLDGFDGKLNSSKWAKITRSPSDTALRDINDLVERGVLKKELAGGRSTSYELV